MPKVEEHTLIEKTEGEVGAKHQQKYREGKRVETYIVETTQYENTNNKKRKQTFIHLSCVNLYTNGNKAYDENIPQIKSSTI